MARGNTRPRSNSRRSPATKVARPAASAGIPLRFASARVRIPAERSNPTTSTPARATSQATLPVPEAPSSTGPPHSRARATYHSASPAREVPGAKVVACMAS